MVGENCQKTECKDGCLDCEADRLGEKPILFVLIEEQLICSE